MILIMSWRKFSPGAGTLSHSCHLWRTGCWNGTSGSDGGQLSTKNPWGVLVRPLAHDELFPLCTWRD